ncbi:MAG: hypothetical protein IT436_10605 [Phycisphaerales bacterium]|nr:hypothetical protein [Phycisphaerales bacterium]
MMSPGKSLADAAATALENGRLLTELDRRARRRRSGPELAASLLSAHPRLRVLFTSGYAEDMALPGVAGPARSAFLSKPYTPTTLTRAVREMLDR